MPPSDIRKNVIGEMSGKAFALEHTFDQMAIAIREDFSDAQVENAVLGNDSERQQAAETFAAHMMANYPILEEVNEVEIVYIAKVVLDKRHELETA